MLDGGQWRKPEGSPARQGTNSEGPRGRVGGWAVTARDVAPWVLGLIMSCADWGCTGSN